MAANTAEREAFEAWASTIYRYVPMNRFLDGDYRHPGIQSDWQVWQAARATPPAGAVPAGWQWVPIEPTEEMDSAARAECHRMKGVIDPVIHIWDVMLAAAPSPDAPAGGKEP